ncbi:hypothetical protein [Pseudophaeobacter sp.]|uniref:lipopolysaccharide biosynthesis protein n=1 Tax=Pseudophaeobacter sp. TaxID=1971739 RepID=UPI0026384AFC|nr:hypothetical protein [Pseudophaeobacter sp.]
MTGWLFGLMRKISGPMALATSSQMISSITNFLFVLTLIAQLSPSGFGLYSIAFAVMLGGTAVLQGFFQLQMVTTLPKIEEDHRSDFAAALFFAQLGTTLLVATPITVVLGATVGATEIWGLSCTTALAILGLSGKEFLIRFLFASFRETLWIPTINLLASATLGIMVYAGVTAGGAGFAMLAYGIAQIAAMLLGLLVVKPVFRPRDVGAPLRAILANGAWGAFSALTYSARASAHTIIVGATLTLSDVGHMNAARTLLTPATLMIPTLSAVFLPRMSRTMADFGHLALRTMALRTALALSALVCLYAGVLAVAWPMLTRLFLGEEFDGLESYVLLWSFFAVAIAMRNVTEWTFQAMQSFRALSMYNLLAAAVTLASVAILTPAWGVRGAIFGLIIGEILLTVVVVKAFGASSRSQRQPEI